MKKIVVIGMGDVLNLSGKPGALHVWNAPVFWRHTPWMAGEFPMIHALTKALAITELAGGLPKQLCFLFIEPQSNENCHDTAGRILRHPPTQTKNSRSV